MALALHDLFQQLCALAEALGISVRQDAIEGSRGGLYIFKGKRHLLVNRDLPMDEKIDVLTETLKKENLDKVYVLPAVREWLYAG
jgi:hypothetical protein